MSSGKWIDPERRKHSRRGCAATQPLVIDLDMKILAGPRLRVAPLEREIDAAHVVQA